MPLVLVFCKIMVQIRLLYQNLNNVLFFFNTKIVFFALSTHL